VIKATVPRLNLDDVFEQKSETARAGAYELEKVCSFYELIIYLGCGKIY